VAGLVYPPFEDVRPQLEQEAAGAAQAAGGELVDAFRQDLGVRVNPRYEDPEERKDGVVDFLGEDGAAAPAGAGTPGN
jgi:peptidyl-prolyl cis-trans isomerase SurA